MSNEGPEKELLGQAVRGDRKALADLYGLFRERLYRMVRLRMDHRLEGRLDPSDVLQDSFLDVWQRFPDYVANPTDSFLVWLRGVVGQKLTDLHRFHLGTQKRTAAREVSLYRGPLPQTSSVSLAEQLLGKLTSPSVAAIRAELKLQVQELLNNMDAIDREVLSMRHFEHMSNKEIAEALNLKPAAASNRYVRALKHLQRALAEIPGLAEAACW